MNLMIIIIIILVNYLFKNILTDCGPPGKASGSEFSPYLSQRYRELFEVTYRCTLDLKLFNINDENKRICRNGEWIGEKPNCGLLPIFFVILI